MTRVVNPGKSYHNLSRVVNPGWTVAETERVVNPGVRNRGGNRKGGQPREYVTANTCYVVGTPQHTVSSKV